MTDRDIQDLAAANRTAWQCRRGMRELDELLGDFLVRRYTQLNEQEQQTFNDLLEYPDTVLLELLMGRMMPADGDIARLVQEIRHTTAN
jgi:antitoxin CptB